MTNILLIFLGLGLAVSTWTYPLNDKGCSGCTLEKTERSDTERAHVHNTHEHPTKAPHHNHTHHPNHHHLTIEPSFLAEKSTVDQSQATALIHPTQSSASTSRCGTGCTLETFKNDFQFCNCTKTTIPPSARERFLIPNVTQQAGNLSQVTDYSSKEPTTHMIASSQGLTTIETSKEQVTRIDETSTMEISSATMPYNTDKLPQQGTTSPSERIQSSQGPSPSTVPVAQVSISTPSNKLTSMPQVHSTLIPSSKILSVLTTLALTVKTTHVTTTPTTTTEDICDILCAAQVGGDACQCSKPGLPG